MLETTTINKNLNYKRVQTDLDIQDGEMLPTAASAFVPGEQSQIGGATVDEVKLWRRLKISGCRFINCLERCFKITILFSISQSMVDSEILSVIDNAKHPNTLRESFINATVDRNMNS